MTTNFGPIDGAIILAYLAMLTGIGIYFSRRQSNLNEYFLAGKTMGWLPVGMSLMAALNSGIDYIMGPSGTIIYGLIFTVSVLSWFVLYLWVAYVTIPFYRRLNVVSAYEYLERRFDGRVRTLGAVIFLFWRMGWMATAIYVPCLVMSTVSGGRLPVLALVLLLGAVVTIYTMLGGIKAVIWTEVIQFCVMLAGLAITVGVVIYHVPGGVGEIWRAASAGGRTALMYHVDTPETATWFESLRLYLNDPRTLFGILFACIVGRMTVYTGDQVMVQRFQTTKSIKDSRQGFIINALGDSVWTLGLAFVGLGLYAFYQVNHKPADIQPDQTVPYFMATMFPTGVLGLVLAATLAASLSSIASAINSCTSVAVVDFYNRFRSKDDPAKDDERHQVRISRIATVVFGIIGIILAANVSRVGNILEIANKVIQTFTGPLLGIYLMGMFSRKIAANGALIGGIAGTAIGIYVAFFTKIGFIWPTIFGLFAALVIGRLVAFILPSSMATEATNLTWSRVMEKPLPDGDLEDAVESTTLGMQPERV